MKGRDGTSTREVGGRYRLLEHLGSGGMGTVWRAEDAVLGRQVAVKEVVFPHGLSDEERETLRERTRREARAAARLDHPSAVTVYDVVEEDGQPWLVLELVEADTLAEVVRRDGPLGPQRTAEVGLAVLGALEAAHARGIVHRDVKPSNVLLGAAGRVVLTDFGIATSTGDASITSTGLLLGSPSYISPERARGGAPAPASDLWALGATLFTAVEGRAPYDKGEPLPTMTAVVTGDREPYRAAGPLVPVLDGLLEADPERRLDARSARLLLEQVARGSAVAPARPPAPPPPASDARAAEQTAALPLPPVPRARPAADQEPATDPRAAVPTSALPAPGPAAPPRRRVPVPPPAAPRRERRTGTLLLGVALGVAAVAGAGYGLTALQDGTADAPTAAATPEAPPDGGDAPAPVPEGFVEQELDEGAVAVVPATYERSRRNAITTQFRDPETRRTLRVQVVPGAGREDAIADREEFARDFSSRFPSYRQISLEPVDYRGDTGADLEFTYSDDGADLHVLNRVFQVDGTGYSLWFQTNESEWEAAQDDLEAVLESFRPAGTADEDGAEED